MEERYGQRDSNNVSNWGKCSALYSYLTSLNLFFHYPLPCIVRRSNRNQCWHRNGAYSNRPGHSTKFKMHVSLSRPLQPTLLGPADAVNPVADCRKPRILKLVLEDVLSKYVVVGRGLFSALLTPIVFLPFYNFIYLFLCL